MMDNQERIDALLDAQEKLDEAVELIKDALRGHRLYERARGYLISDLEMAAHAETSWLGSNMANIDSLIESLEDDCDTE